MTIPVPQPDKQSVQAAGSREESQPVMPSQKSASQPLILPRQSEEEQASNSHYFYFEDEQPDLETPFVAPFQVSHAMPTVFTQAQRSDQLSSVPPAPATPKTKTNRQLRLSLPLIAIVVCVVLIVGLFVMNALAQTTPPLQTRGDASPSIIQQTEIPKDQQKSAMNIPTPVPTSGANGQGQEQAFNDWVPQQLPNGWTNAGLFNGDAIQALRTAVAFTDREMSLDYRSVGTRNNHGGTFTAATFLLTPAAKQRFVRNDVRAINNILFDKVVNTKMIRLVVNPQPQLVKFIQVDQQQFAWVDVAFELWQSQLDPVNQEQRVEGKDQDPMTNQPRVYHMMVLLLRVQPQDTGANPAMGGTGWLVSNYGLDLPNGTALNIVQPA